jgi:hypothetical protein
VVRDGRFPIAGVLIGIAALGFVVVAGFPADPFKGYPPGAIQPAANEISDDAKLHGLGFMTIFGGIVLAAANVAWRSRKVEMGSLAASTLAAMLAIIGCLAIGFSNQNLNSEAFFAVGIFGFG